MTAEECKSCIQTIELLRRLAFNVHGVMDVIDAENCDKIIKMLEADAQQWTPCNKSLPIEDYYPDDNEYHSKWAWVTIKSRQTGKRYMDIARTVNGKWEMLHSDFDGGFPCKDVPYWADIVAWMPLPEPWKGEKQ